MDCKEMNILIAGVGGQGTVLTGRVLGRYAFLKGLDCKLSEVHGMSQRGGSVVTHVRFGKSVHSPVIWEGGADIILAFEQLEAVRAAHFLKPDGIMIVNDVMILPMPCISGASKYPDNIRSELLKNVNSRFLEASALAKAAGSSKAVNVIIMGAMTKLCGLDFETMKQAITECVPQRFLELNLTAFMLGYQKI